MEQDVLSLVVIIVMEDGKYMIVLHAIRQVLLMMCALFLSYTIFCWPKTYSNWILETKIIRRIVQVIRCKKICQLSTYNVYL